MRTSQRDQGGVVTFDAAVSDAPSGSGVGQPGGIPFAFTRIATGTYRLNFDPRLTPIAAGANATATAYNASAVNLAAGTAQVTLGNAAFAGTNGSFSFSITARDART
jgi:hypothetical protein